MAPSSTTADGPWALHLSEAVPWRVYADGGIARLRVYGVGQRDWSSVSNQERVDLIAMANGGVCLGYSDAHFGHPRNMIGRRRYFCELASLADGHAWLTASFLSAQTPTSY